MRTGMVVGAALLLALGGLAGHGLRSQDLAQYTSGQDMVPELAKPGPEHAILAKLAGKWEQTYSMAMMPGQPRITSTGSATGEMILGGRFLETRSTAEMMGQPVESRSLFGFDRRHQVWTVVGFDTMGTYFVTGSGKRDADGIIRMHGTDDDPAGKQVYYYEIEIKSDDEYLSRIFFTQLGSLKFDEPFMVMEVRAVRKKD